jgi:hypothetical protein
VTVERTVRLRFGEFARSQQTHVNLSAVRADGPVLWVAGDESSTIERLVAYDPDEPHVYGGQVGYPLGDLVRLPSADDEDEVDEEADIEGLARTGDWLWAVGSHSLGRKRIKAKHDGDKAVRRLATISGQKNRQIITRIPVTDLDGRPGLVREAGDRRAAVFGSHGEDLRHLLADDPLLAPFLPIPGKDNGLDIEGIAVSGNRVYLGLRGPVLRGWAVVLELRPEEEDAAPGELALRAFPDGRRYRTHVLGLRGLGVRDLCPHGDDLLVLAGPSMDLDGPVHVFRWRGGCSTSAPTVVRGDALAPVVDLPYGVGTDHAEGIGLIGSDDEPRLIVVYDSPGPDRLGADGSVTADVVRI